MWMFRKPDYFGTANSLSPSTSRFEFKLDEGVSMTKCGVIQRVHATLGSHIVTALNSFPVTGLFYQRRSAMAPKRRKVSDLTEDDAQSFI